MLQELAKSRSVIAPASPLVGEDAVDPVLVEGIDLLVEMLLGRRNSCVSEAVSVGAHTYLSRKSSRSLLLRRKF